MRRKRAMPSAQIPMRIKIVTWRRTKYKYKEEINYQLTMINTQVANNPHICYLIEDEDEKMDGKEEEDINIGDDASGIIATVDNDNGVTTRQID